MIDRKNIEYRGVMMESYLDLIKRNVIHLFRNNDVEYEEWLANNKQGYVFNHFGGGDKSKEMNKIHRANCSYLYRKQDAGKRTTTYEKICSNSLEELESVVTDIRGTSWVYCKVCMK
jgi:hypothetical protein